MAPYPAEGLDWSAGMGAENVEELSATLGGSRHASAAPARIGWTITDT